MFADLVSRALEWVTNSKRVLIIGEKEKTGLLHHLEDRLRPPFFSVYLSTHTLNLQAQTAQHMEDLLVQEVLRVFVRQDILSVPQGQEIADIPFGAQQFRAIIDRAEKVVPAPHIILLWDEFDEAFAGSHDARAQQTLLHNHITALLESPMGTHIGAVFAVSPEYDTHIQARKPVFLNCTALHLSP